MSTPLASVEIFYSYANTDGPLLEKLEKHLSVLQREGLVTAWHKRQIHAGANYRKELNHHLNTASLILLLISSDYLSSDYCYGVEMQRAIQRHETNEARVIPILLRPVSWQNTPLGKFQALPRNGKPITSWSNRDEAFAAVVQDIRIALEDMRQLTISIPSVAFPKIWQVPYARNPVFTGRKELLHTLTQILQTEQPAILSQPQTQALSGLGGIGKTQLAVEYAYQHAQCHQAVFWVGAETPEIIMAGYVALAETLQLPEREEREQSLVVKAVLRWLERHTGWLLILDNMEDLSLLRSFLPSISGGRVIVTTRTQTTGRAAHQIEVKVLSAEDGALLLLRRAGLISAESSLEQASADDIACAHQICEDLGGLPLALDQAGAFLEETQCSLQDYRQRYQSRQAFFLQRRGSLAADHPDPVTTTWSLAFEKIEQRNTVAADLLRFCAFLSPDAIPIAVLLTGARVLGPALSPIAADPLLLDEAIAVLNTYSLVSRNARMQTISIHRLVQAVLKGAMEKETHDRWAKRTILAVSEALPSAEFATWTQCEQLLPHAQVCATLIVERKLQFPKAAEILYWTGDYLLERFRIQEAGPLLQSALTWKEEGFGLIHPETATAVDRLARWFELQGKYTEAEKLYQQALAICEQQLGGEHPNIAGSLNNLALLYEEQRRYAEAEPLYQQALAIDTKVHGSDHPSVATVLNNLALLYEKQGRYAEAELSYQRALAIDTKAHGSDHPSIAISLNNLALLYEKQERYAEAELSYQRALAIDTQVHGLNHPETATTLDNLAFLYHRQEKDVEAEPLYLQALAIREQQLGVEHPDTIRSLYGLAILYWMQGRDVEAEPLLKRTLTLQETMQLGLSTSDGKEIQDNCSMLLQAIKRKMKAPL